MKIKPITIALTGISMLVTVVFYSCQKDAVQSQNPTAKTTSAKSVSSLSKPDYKLNFTPAKTSNELIAIRANHSNNIIRTLADFDNIVASYNTPLSTLTKEQIASFRQDIVVRDSIGVVGLNYKKVYTYLSDSDFDTVMNMFGLDAKEGFWGFSKDIKVIQALQTKVLSSVTPVRGTTTVKLAEDYKGYACVSAHNCSVNSDYICLTGC